MIDDVQMFTVTDIKQFIYCRRVVFYEQCLPHVRPRTFKMDAGREAHQDEQRLASRRSLTKLHLTEGKRVFDVALTSPSLKLTGTVDEVVYPTQGSPIPIDYKLAKQASKHYKLQLAAYALLLQECENVTISLGYIYLIPSRKLVRVNIDTALKNSVRASLTQMWDMVYTQAMPPPAETRSFCLSCEFRRFCNDV